VAVGLYTRLKVLETPAFALTKKAGRQAEVPFVELVRTHQKNVLLGLGARYIEGVTFNTFGVFIIAYVTTFLTIKPADIIVAGNAEADMLTIKYSGADGSVIWEKRRSNGTAQAAAVDGSGNVVIADSGFNTVRVVAARSGTFYRQAMTAGDIYTVAAPILTTSANSGICYGM